MGEVPEDEAEFTQRNAEERMRGVEHRRGVPVRGNARK